MMRKYLVSFILGLFFIAVNGNPLTFHPRYVNSYQFSATDVWNLDVQFTGAAKLNIYMIAIVSAKGKPVCTIKSGAFQLVPGAQSYSATTVNTSLLTYHSQAIADIESITGSFPSGTYTVCYNAYCVTGDCDGQGSDALYNEYPECFELLVEPPTPILLAIPEDKAELEWKRPTFNWIPPMPIATVNGFNYRYILVERSKNQSCPDAVIRNRPMYYQIGIDQPTLPYPAEMNDLDTGKVYCWKVDGLVESVPVAQSEVWEFRLKPEEIEKKDTFKFAKFTTRLDAGNIQVRSNSVLYFVCTGSYNGEFLRIQMSGDDNYSYLIENNQIGVEKVEIARPNEYTNVLQHFGINKYSMDLSKIPGLATGYFTLEVLGENHVPYFLKIQIVD